MKRLALILALILLAATAGQAKAVTRPRNWVEPAPETVPNHRAEWRFVVTELANYAKARRKDFAILIRNGMELVIKGDRETHWEELADPSGRDIAKRLPNGAAFRPFVKVIDGLVIDNFYCGPFALGRPLATAISERQKLDRELADERARGVYRAPVPTVYGPFSIDPAEELKRARHVREEAEREEQQRRRVYAVNAMREAGRQIMSIETCKTQKDADAARQDAARDKILSYISVGNGALDLPPASHPPYENASPVTSLTAARNWQPMLRADKYGTRAQWVMELTKSNQDLLVVDVAHRGVDGLTPADVKSLKYKGLGSPRLVFAHLSVGKAFDWRWYWQKGWEAGNPSFLFAIDEERPGSFYVDLNNAQWREMLGKYLAAIIDVGFDGVVFDDVDTYLWYEDLMPLGPVVR